LTAHKAKIAEEATLVESPVEQKTVAAARRRVLAWWDRHRREFPWRALRGRAPDSYFVWLSEIMLQQTNVTTAVPYFERFTRRWPSVESLAQASLDEVVDEFAGLGYYSRARNLHACAKAVSAQGGAFPQEVDGLRALPGVGDYTAKAVAAIAFGRACVPIDANIRRVLCRFYGVERMDRAGGKRLMELSGLWAAHDRPGDFAQALMDLGALVCRAREADCGSCPLGADCVAARSDPTLFPAPKKKAARKMRFGVAFYARDRRGNFLVRRRPEKGLLAGTLELPGAIGIDEPTHAAALKWRPFAGKWEKMPESVEHVFTHFTLRLTVYRGLFERLPEIDGGYAMMPWGPESLDKLSSAMAKAARYAHK
jgi:A/G-specific adenine glycosylase